MEITKLSDITGQDIGVIIYPDGASAAVVNWVNTIGVPTFDGEHMDLCGNYIPSKRYVTETATHTDDLRAFMPEVEDLKVVADAKGLLPKLYASKVEGVAYKIGHCTVLAPDRWRRSMRVPCAVPTPV